MVCVIKIDTRADGTTCSNFNSIYLFYLFIYLLIYLFIFVDFISLWWCHIKIDTRADSTTCSNFNSIYLFIYL